MARIDTLREYLRLAQLQPELNKLYIEDLHASIEYEERKPFAEHRIMSGFVDNDPLIG